MTIEIQNVQRLRVWTESTFASDGTGTLGNYTDVPFIEGSMTASLDQEMLDPQTAQQRKDGMVAKVLGKKSAKLTFSMHLAATGADTTDGNTAAQSALGEILSAVMGGENLATGTAADTGSTTTSIVADTAYSTDTITNGCAIGLLSGASAAYEMRELSTITTVTGTPKIAVSNAPNSADDIYATATYYLTDTSTVSHLQFIVEGAEQDDRWLVLGCQAESVAIEISNDQLPKITFTFMGADWMHGADTAGTLTGSALGAATYTNLSLTRVFGELLIQTNGTSTRPSPTCASSFTVTPQIKYEPVPCPSGTNGIAQFLRMRAVPVMAGSFTTYYPDTTWFDHRDSSTALGIFYQIGNVAGSTVLLSFPTVQVTNVQRVDDGGRAAQKVDFECRLDTHTTGTSDLTDSAFRIHLG